MNEQIPTTPQPPENNSGWGEPQPPQDNNPVVPPENNSGWGEPQMPQNTNDWSQQPPVVPPQPQNFQQPPMPPYNAGPKMQSSPGDRLVAALLDTALGLVTCGIGWLIWFFIVADEGYTPGKKIRGLQVIDTKTGQPLSLGKMLLREWILKGVIGSLCTLLDFWMFWDNDKNQLWDKVLDTTVVYDGTK